MNVFALELRPLVNTYYRLSENSNNLGHTQFRRKDATRQKGLTSESCALMAVPWQLAVTRNWKDWLVSLSWSGEFELNCFAAVFLADISELSLPQISWNWSCLKYHEKGCVWRDFLQWTTTLQRSSNFQGRNHACKRVKQPTPLFSLNSKYKRGEKRRNFVSYLL